MKKSERDHIRDVFKGSICFFKPVKEPNGSYKAVDESHIMHLLDNYERLVEALSKISKTCAADYYGPGRLAYDLANEALAKVENA